MANWYVTPTGGGLTDGTDWSNAFNDFTDVVWGASGVDAGDTLYVAGGSYGATCTIGASGTSGNHITIKKAISTDHGTDTGWVGSWGTTSATLSGDGFYLSNKDYVDVDGQVEDGFVVNSTVASIERGFQCLSACTNITGRYISMDGNTNGDDFRGVYLFQGSNFTFSNLKIENMPNDPFVVVSVTAPLIIENCLIGPKITSATGKHGDVCEVTGTTGTCTFRNNIVDWSGDGVHLGIQNSPSDTWDVYGNLFIDGTPIKHNSDNAVVDYKVYNNVFYQTAQTVLMRSNGTGDAKNNIFFENTLAPGFVGMTHDYNFWHQGSGEPSAPSESNGIISTNDPFVLAGTDFRLSLDSEPIDAGANVGATYNTDPDGNTRGADGSWDMGIYEFQGQEPVNVVLTLASWLATVWLLGWVVRV